MSGVFSFLVGLFVWCVIGVVIGVSLMLPVIFALVLVKGVLELCWPERFVHGRGRGSD